LRGKTAEEVIQIIEKDHAEALKLYGGVSQIRRRGELFGRLVNVVKLRLVYSLEFAPTDVEVLKAVEAAFIDSEIELLWL